MSVASTYVVSCLRQSAAPSFSTWNIFSVSYFFLLCYRCPFLLDISLFLRFTFSFSVSVPSVLLSEYSIYMSLVSLLLHVPLYFLFHSSTWILWSVFCFTSILYIVCFLPFQPPCFPFCVCVFLLPLAFPTSTFSMPPIFLCINSWNEVSVGCIILQYLTVDDDTRRLGPFTILLVNVTKTIWKTNFLPNPWAEYPFK